MYTVSVIFKAKLDKIDDMQKVIHDVYLPSLKEQGMLEYRWYQSAEKQNEFLLFMTWESEEAFKLHVQTAHVQKAERDLTDILIASAPELYWHYMEA